MPTMFFSCESRAESIGGITGIAHFRVYIWHAAVTVEQWANFILLLFATHIDVKRKTEMQSECEPEENEKILFVVFCLDLPTAAINIRHICREFHFDINIRVCCHPTTPTDTYFLSLTF